MSNRRSRGDGSDDESHIGALRTGEAMESGSLNRNRVPRRTVRTASRAGANPVGAHRRRGWYPIPVHALIRRTLYQRAAALLASDDHPRRLELRGFPNVTNRIAALFVMRARPAPVLYPSPRSTTVNGGDRTYVMRVDGREFQLSFSRNMNQSLILDIPTQWEPAHGSIFTDPSGVMRTRAPWADHGRHQFATHWFLNELPPPLYSRHLLPGERRLQVIPAPIIPPQTAVGTLGAPHTSDWSTRGRAQLIRHQPPHLPRSLGPVTAPQYPRRQVDSTGIYGARRPRSGLWRSESLVDNRVETTSSLRSPNGHLPSRSTDREETARRIDNSIGVPELERQNGIAMELSERRSRHQTEIESVSHFVNSDVRGRMFPNRHLLQSFAMTRNPRQGAYPIGEHGALGLRDRRRQFNNLTGTRAPNRTRRELIRPGPTTPSVNQSARLNRPLSFLEARWARNSILYHPGQLVRIRTLGNHQPFRGRRAATSSGTGAVVRTAVRLRRGVRREHDRSDEEVEEMLLFYALLAGEEESDAARELLAAG